MIYDTGGVVSIHTWRNVMGETYYARKIRYLNKSAWCMYLREPVIAEYMLRRARIYRYRTNSVYGVYRGAWE